MLKTSGKQNCSSPLTYSLRKDEHTIHFKVRVKKDVSVPRNKMETEELFLRHGFKKKDVYIIFI